MLLSRFSSPFVPRTGMLRLIHHGSSGSPSHLPGYLMFERLEDLSPSPPAQGSVESPNRQKIKSIADRISKALPFLNIGGMTDEDAQLPSSKLLLPNLRNLYSRKDMELSIKFYPNQEPFSPVNLIKNSPNYSLMTKSGLLVTSPAESLDDRRSFLSADDVEDGEVASYRCTNVLKKRRRKMRRHKHKKRLRENRYKSK